MIWTRIILVLNFKRSVQSNPKEGKALSKSYHIAKSQSQIGHVNGPHSIKGVRMTKDNILNVELAAILNSLEMEQNPGLTFRGNFRINK